MTKPNPFFKNERERDEIAAKRDMFKFSDPNDPAQLIVLIAGREGSGKTHLACTMSELGPVYLLDTEYRAQIVTRKFRNVKFATVKNFTELVIAVSHIIKHQPAGTIVIDSGSDLQTFAEIEYLDRTKMEKVYPIFNWSDVWAMANALIDEIKFSRKFNLVITSRVKEEYVGDRPTGQIVPRIYSTLPYKADLVLQFSHDKDKRLLVAKNGFTGDLTGQLSRTDTLPQIIQRLSQSAPSALKRVI